MNASLYSTVLHSTTTESNSATSEPPTEKVENEGPVNNDNITGLYTIWEVIFEELKFEYFKYGYYIEFLWVLIFMGAKFHVFCIKKLSNELETTQFTYFSNQRPPCI